VWEIRAVAHAETSLTREGRGEALVKCARIVIAEAQDAEGAETRAVIGIACPGVINEDGSIEKGAQKPAGNWESSKFNP